MDNHLKFLIDPEGQDGIIATNIKSGSPTKIDGKFIPTWDDTDHFHFVCRECKGVADTLNASYNAGKIYFYLRCRECHKHGQRKINLKIGTHNGGDWTLDQGKIYVYAGEKKPFKEIPIIPKDEDLELGDMIKHHLFGK